MPAGRPTLREEQQALTRRRLLQAGATVFARCGFHAASVEEIAREAGATTGALYSNFVGKEDLFLAVFEASVAAELEDYSKVIGAAASAEEKERAPADRWMEILRERPDYFPLFIEFWTHAIRKPALRGSLGKPLEELRNGNARLIAAGAAEQGFDLPGPLAEKLGMLVTALGNGLALEKLVNPEAVPDELFGDLVVMVLAGLAGPAQQ